MIESLYIRGFQKHRRLDLQLDPRVTTIIGKTGSGKSSILRALKWVCTNRPGGDSFISWGKDEVTVQIDLETLSVSRSRGPSENFYQWNNYEQDERKYNAIGAGVPDDIAKILNVGPENFSGQRDDPFWLCKTGGELAKELNAVVNLDLIDSTMANIASELKKTRSEISVRGEDLQTAEIKRNSLYWVVGAHVDLESLEKLQATLEETRQKRSRLSDLFSKVQQTLQDKSKSSEEAIEAQKLIDEMKAWKEISCKVNKLINLMDQKYSLDREIIQWVYNSKKAKEKIRKTFKGKCPICRSVMK